MTPLTHVIKEWPPDMRMAPHVLRRHLALPYGLPGVLPCSNASVLAVPTCRAFTTAVIARGYLVGRARNDGAVPYSQFYPHTSG
jgi:hypothetical protein